MDKISSSNEALIAEGVSDYGSRSYWNTYYNERNRDEAIDEWYLSYDDIKALLVKEIDWNKDKSTETKKLRVLYLGCGKSTVGYNVAHDLDCKVDNIDFSEAAIQFMNGSFGNTENYSWTCSSCTNMKFDDESIDVAIDKATFDSVQCGTLPRESIADYCKEVQRVLKVGGKWIVISHAPPEMRLEYFFNDDDLFGPLISFDVRVQLLHKNVEIVDSDEDNCHAYFGYICQKK